MQKTPLVVPNKSCKAYFKLDNNSKVYFTGDFDSGNLQKVQQLSPSTFRITPGFDKTRQTTQRTCFHFKVQGLRNCMAKFIVTRVCLLEPMIKVTQKQSKNEGYRPVVRRYPHQPFEKVTKDVQLYYNSQGEVQLSFQFAFQQQNWVQFALTYPYSYQDCQDLIRNLQEQYKKDYEIYFHAETLTRTSQDRRVHLLTITDRRNISKERMESVDQILEEGDRPFKIDKPRVVISARVHPGQTPASHCMQGVIRFLLNKNDYRSYLLRKHFHFNIIPMVNPQAVFEGMFRSDLNGDNLNRVYLQPHPRKHKSIWAIQKWVESLDRVDFFFDLHAHPSRKGFFIYGNAFDEFIEQIQAQIFSKMLEYNCPYFQNLDCIYSESAMDAKDRHDTHTKQGCARVFYHKKFKMIHAYTVECGYFGPTKLNRYPPQRQFLAGSQLPCSEEWESISMKQYTSVSYMLMGKALMVSILDLFHLNPFSRISTSDFKSIHSLRKFTAQRIYNEVQRFRLIDSNCYRKIRDIASLIEQHYYIPRFKDHGMSINQNYGIRRWKKTYSINARIYKQKGSKSKGINSEKKIALESKEYQHEDQYFEQQQVNNSLLQGELLNKGSSEQLSFSPSLPKIKINSKKLLTGTKRPNKSSSASILQKDKLNFLASNQMQSQQLAVLPARYPMERKEDISLMLRKEQVPFIRQVEKEIMEEIMRKKNKKNQKGAQISGQAKMERLESFLKKEEKGRLPSLQGDTIGR